MAPSALRDVLRHEAWATARLVEFCDGLEPGQLELTAPGVDADVAQTLARLVESVELHIQALTGAPAEVDGAGIVARARRIGRALERVATDERDPDEMLPVDGTTGMSRGTLVAQLLYDGYERRAQVRAILAAHGVATPALDAWSFARERQRAPRLPAIATAPLALGIVLLCAATLRLWGLWDEGLGNQYYAATVRSMLSSAHNFFYASFDPGGFVSVDKPPLGFWVQAGFVTLFGFSGLSLLVPQALAGIAAAAVLYHLVARTFGPWPGVLAAGVLATTPIAVAADRNNTVEAQVMLALLLAAWAIFRYEDSGRLRWLVASMALVGVAFDMKMLEAYVALPAVAALAVLAARPPLWRRASQLGLGVLALVVVSFWWPVAVDLTPSDARPYVGSSRGNSELELVFGHNGIGRILGPGFALVRGAPGPPPPGPAAPPGQLVPPPPPPPQGQGPLGEIGEPGLLRLLNQQLGGQASWLVPFALFGAVAAAARIRLTWPLARTHALILFWTLWLVPQLAAYSVANLIHRYYLELMAPGIAALVGIGAFALWRDHREGGARRWLLPSALAATALTEGAIIVGHPEWSGVLAPVAVGAPLALAAALAVLRRVRPRVVDDVGAASLAVAAVAALFVAPVAWALTPLLGSDQGLPFAGPELVARPRQPAPPGGISRDDALASFLLRERGDARFIAATLNTGVAAPLILSTGQPVMALGGFSGSDPILDVDRLRARVRAGEVRFFLLPRAPQNALVRWVLDSCAAVPAERWRRAGPGNFQPQGPGGLQELFDCGRVGQAGMT